MRDLPRAVSILVLSLLVAGGLTSAVVAKDAKPSMAKSPVVGAWLLDVDGDLSTPPTQAVFHADGTYLQTDAGGVGVGSWLATGPSTGALTFSVYDLEETGGFSSATVRAILEASADGQSISGTFTLEQISGDGSSTGQMGPLTATGTRIPVEPMGSPAEPGTPEESPAP
jgi:hypothetical protein